MQESSFTAFPSDHLEHHGIKGQKWGVRRFQNSDGTYTQAGKERYGPGSSVRKGEAFVQSVGGRKVSDLVAGSINAEAVIPILSILAPVSIAAIGKKVLSVAAENKLRKNLMSELERLNKEKAVKSFDDCPRLQHRMKPEDSMKVINPDFPDLGTTMNCTYCTTAMALRERGYDVKAAKMPNGVGMFDDDLFQATFHSPTIKMGKMRSGKEVIDTLAKCGDSAYGNLSVQWKLGGGHSLFWKNENGRTRIYDAQSGEEITKSSSIKKFMDSVDLKHIDYHRLDNCEPTEYALAVVESNAEPKKE